MISDAGFQGEITSISTAAQQIEVFSRVLKSAIVGFLQSSDDWQNSVNECAVSVLKLFKNTWPQFSGLFCVSEIIERKFFIVYKLLYVYKIKLKVANALEVSNQILLFYFHVIVFLL